MQEEEYSEDRAAVKKLLERAAARLAAADPRYRAFAAKLTHLARNFQSKAILHFIEENLDERVST